MKTTAACISSMLAWLSCHSQVSSAGHQLHGALYACTHAVCGQHYFTSLLHAIYPKSLPMLLSCCTQDSRHQMRMLLHAPSALVLSTSSTLPSSAGLVSGHSGTISHLSLEMFLSYHKTQRMHSSSTDLPAVFDGHASDVWAAGLVGYELLFGCKPFPSLMTQENYNIEAAQPKEERLHNLAQAYEAWKVSQHSKCTIAHNTRSCPPAASVPQHKFVASSQIKLVVKAVSVGQSMYHI